MFSPTTVCFLVLLRTRCNLCLVLTVSDAGCSVIAVIISVTKEGVKFSTAGDIGTANIVCRQNKTVDKVSYDESASG